VSILIPEINKKLITPHTEELQPVVWHLIVSHPDLKEKETKWESL
jgi:D-sedoheptulose 7-phosphate isomerase